MGTPTTILMTSMLILAGWIYTTYSIKPDERCLSTEVSTRTIPDYKHNQREYTRFSILPYNHRQGADILGMERTSTGPDSVTKSGSNGGQVSARIAEPLSYKLEQTSRTSAGVYDGNSLVRTLWSNKLQSAGMYSLEGAWDGTDDEGKAVADKPYTIKVVSNQVTYQWLAPVGNTSLDSTGPGVHNSTQLYTNMVQVGQQMYCANGYNEVGDSHIKFTIGQPNRLTTTLKSGCMVPRFIATDGDRVYYSGQARDGITFTTAIKAKATEKDSLYQFSTGRQIAISGNNDYRYSSIDYDSVWTVPSGLGVQKSGNYLLVTHATANQLRVFDKKTGSLLRTNTLLSPRHLAMQTDSLLWLAAYSPHMGGTTSTTLTGTPTATPKAGTGYEIQNAFDGIPGKVYRSQGGALNFMGLTLNSPAIITQIRIKPEAGRRFSGNLRGMTGWENVQIGTINITADGYTTVNITSSLPFREVTLEWNDGGQIFVDELEVIGYTYRGREQVSQYKLKADGTLTGPIQSLSDITQALSVAVSQDGSVVAVADRGNPAGGTYNQVKLYSTSTGSLLRTIGRAESYANPTVYDDKFYFNNTRIFMETDYGASRAFVAFQSDGSLWIGDYGNMRCQHFSQTGTYIDNIQYMGYSYNCRADVNNPTRVFSDFLEFTVDYKDNSWRFVRNWSKNITVPVVYDENRMRSVATLPNGRTYCLYAAQFPNNAKEILELDNTIGVRHTNLFTDDYNVDLNPDGSLLSMSFAPLGQPIIWKRKALTGFDSKNNPLLSNYVQIETSPTLIATDPVSPDGYGASNQISSNGVIAVFNGDKSTERGSGYHLGGIKNGKWLFRTSSGTRPDYRGDYPGDGAFDIGNGVNYPAAFMQVVDSSIFWGYKGENWKQGQTNMYHHYLENGLLVGLFGATGEIAKLDGVAPAKLAGNANSGTYVTVGKDIHLYHCDEGQHAGVHHWKISNLESIVVQTFAVSGSIPAAQASTTNCIDLMEAIPVSGTVASDTGRWKYTPASYYKNDYDQWRAVAGMSTYKRKDRSIRLVSNPVSRGQKQETSCDLSIKTGTVNQLTSWTISGALTYPELSESDYNYLEVVDKAGRVIVRISRPESYPNTSVYVNDVLMVRGLINGAMNNLFSHAQLLEISKSEDQMRVRYGDNPVLTVKPFESGADVASPSQLRVRFYSAETRGHQIDLASMKLCYTPTESTSNSCTTVKDGVWTDPSVWLCNHVPNPDDVVYLKHNLVVPVNYIAYIDRVIYVSPVKLMYEQGAHLVLDKR